jgi:hypothetical protein
MGEELDILLQVSSSEFDEDDEQLGRQLGGISIEILKSQVIESPSLPLSELALTV